MLVKLQTTAFGIIMASQVASASMTGLLGVVNKDDGTASLIDLKSRQVHTVKVGYKPHEIAFGGGYAFVTNYGSSHIRSTSTADRPGNTLAMIRLEAPYVATQIDLGPARCAPHGIVASQNGQRVYVTCEGRHEIAVVDVVLGKVSHFLPTNQAGSHMLVISSDESRAYVANFWLGTVSVIDLIERRLIRQINVGRGCEGIALSADGKELFVTRVEDDEVIKVDTERLEIVQRKFLSQGSSPIRVVTVPQDSENILVNSVGTGTMQILNARDLSLVNEIKVGRQPIGIVASTTHAFVANMKDRSISVINLKTGESSVSGFLTGSSPDGLAWTP